MSDSITFTLTDFKRFNLTFVPYYNNLHPPYCSFYCNFPSDFPFIKGKSTRCLICKINGNYIQSDKLTMPEIIEANICQCIVELKNKIYVRASKQDIFGISIVNYNNNAFLIEINEENTVELDIKRIIKINNINILISRFSHEEIVKIFKSSNKIDIEFEHITSTDTNNLNGQDGTTPQ